MKESDGSGPKAFYLNRKVLLAVWVLLLPLLHLATDFANGRINNYKIFRQVYFHLIQQQPLYTPYPAQYDDINHYGPLFAFVMAPFAMLPDVAGVLLWNIGNAAFLFYVLTRTAMRKHQQNLVIALTSVEMANAMWSTQFNSAVVGMMVLTLVLVEEGKDFKATLLIMLSAFVKIYGVLGLMFFLFSKKKKEFVLGCAFWFAVCLVLPMLFTSPGYILQTYREWFAELSVKNALNISLSSSQDASIPGMLRRILHQPFRSGLPFLVPGALLLLAPLVRVRQYASAQFRYYMVASMLLFISLFSSGSEHPTFIVGMTGGAIWLSYHIAEKRTAGFRWLIPFVLVFAGLGPTDLFTKEFRVFMINYSLKALPFAILWGGLLKDLLLQDFVSPEKSMLRYVARQKKASGGLLRAGEPGANA
ncbi:glycosyltransferase family 87 protein [Flaviaesturariibacter flavus]|uniref:glycosyltransferase family 87 protein n=1 Tax=Flaviaesturariibacter flavus TaxID=2502780 RepID=UPI001404BA48|nr:glycosyltransferase family 87 protein [Flaviaesturariibacter flavus]